MLLTPASCAPDCAPCADCCDCASPDPSIHTLQRRATLLTALTIGWNVVEGVVALASGYVAGSVALLGFGLDSAVEVASALVVLWWLGRQRRGVAVDEATERRAVRLIALSFFGMAAFIAGHAVASLLGFEEAPERSALGLVMVATSLLIMPALAWAKRQVAAGLGSVALQADAAESQLCFYLSGVVLLGLAANQLWSWWWADAVAGLFVAAVAVKEGRAAWADGDLCCFVEEHPRAAVHCFDSCCPVCPVPA